tara:strand:- start:11298 stop:13175 length:1878 start_codon:yes stop_codon:yes gene_type:complete
MVEKIFFLNEIDDDIIVKEKIDSESKIFCFDIKSHYYLEKNDLSHVLAEDYLSEKEKEEVFTLAVDLWKWYEKDEVFKKLNIEKVNYFSILDTSEFHQLIIDKIKYFAMIKRIIEKEKEIETIFATEQLEKLIAPFLEKYDIKLKIINQIFTDKNNTIYEKITIPLKFMGIEKNLEVSRNTFFKIKNLVEKIGAKIFNLILNDFEKEYILFLDINPKQYKKLFESLKNRNKNMVFFNYRRSVLSDLESIKIIRKTGAKIISPNLILSSNEKNKIENLVSKKEKEIIEIWDESEKFKNIFSFEGYQFWDSVKEDLLKIYLSRLKEYFEIVIFGKKVIERINISSIVLLNVIGESEKIIQEMNYKSREMILLEHAFTNYDDKNMIYDILRINYNGKNAVWGEKQSEYLKKMKNIPDENIIITGSPRHDEFYNQIKNESQKYLLILPHTLTSFNAISGVEIFEKQIRILKQIIESIRNYPNVVPIIKLHPVQDFNNKFLKNKIQELFPQVRILQNESILNIMFETESVISILGEVAPSTTLLEALILKKPTLFIDITKKQIPFEFIKDDAVMIVKDDAEVNQSINDLINNKRTRKDLIENGNKFVKKYLSFTGNSSERFSDILCDINE